MIEIVQLFATEVAYGLGGENIGVGRLVSYLKASNVKVAATYLDQKNSLEMESKKIKPYCSLYGFSIYQNNIEFFLNVIKYIKTVNPSAKIVLGSKFATNYFEEILSSPDMGEVDFIILGDGEHSLLELVTHIDDLSDIEDFVKNHKNIVSRKHFKNKYPASLNINTLPWPDRFWMEEHRVITGYICDCHGCIGKCSFCTQSNNYKEWNGRSAEDIFNEILSIHQKYKIRHFIFTGGSLEDPGDVGKQKISSLCKLLSESKYRFSFSYYLRADTFQETVDDISLLRSMKENGFIMAMVGIESGNDDDLKIYNKRATVEQNRSTIALLKKSDIFYGSYGFIMFNPYTTKSKLRDNYRFQIEIGAFNLSRFVTKLIIHKNTNIFEQAFHDGLLSFERKFYDENGYKYRFKDEEINEIHDFVTRRLDTSYIEEKGASIENSVMFIFCFSKFVSNEKDFIRDVQTIMDENTRLLKDYFFYLYEEIDITLCELLYDEFIEQYLNNVRKIALIKNRLFKKLQQEKVNLCVADSIRHSSLFDK